jgi:hypothetical protein
LRRDGQTLTPAAGRRLERALGNGRFIRTLVDKAGAQRDLRLAEATAGNPDNDALTTVAPADLSNAFAELLTSMPLHAGLGA